MLQLTLRSVLRPAWLLTLAGLGTVLLGAGLLGAPPPTLGHADLVASQPAANASLIEPPDMLELTFTEPVDAATISLDVLDAARRSVDGLGGIVLSDDGTAARVSLPDLAPGVYTVNYGVVSTVDGHATTGLFAFAVDPTGAQAPPTEPPVSTSPAVDGWAVAARWLALAGLLVAAGSILIWWFAGRPVPSQHDRGVEQGPPWILIAGAATCGLIGVSLYLVLAARPIAGTVGSPLDLAAPFGWTPFAIAMRVTTLATLLAVVLAATAILRRRRDVEGRADRRLAAAAAVSLAAALGGMSAAGHAASIGGPVFAAIDWLHLVAVAAWLGGLPAAFVLAGGSAQRAATMRHILRGHGPLALLAAPVVVLTGVANSPLVLGSDRALVASGYGNLLIAKALLVSVALGIGATNHLFVRGRGRANLSFLVSAEIGIAALAVMAAATMVTIQPASSRGPELTSPPLTTAHLYGSAGPTRIHASVSLPAPGNQLYQVTVADLETGAPRDDVQRVFLTFTPPKAAELPPQRVELPPTDVATLYGASGAYTPIVGEWTLDVTVRRQGARDESVAFALPVDVPPIPQLAAPPDTGIGVPAPLGVLWSVLPDGPAGWVPSLVALAAALALGGLTVTRKVHGMAYVRLGLLTAATVAALGAGTRELVLAANAPAPAELSTVNPLPADPESVARGERLYLANCASCHGTGSDGDGPVTVIPDAGSLRDVLPHTTDAELAYRIRNGLAGTSMPAFATVLTESERWEVVTYLRHAWGTR